LWLWHTLGAPDWQARMTLLGAMSFSSETA
jgi:hypothetical protein